MKITGRMTVTIYGIPVGLGGPVAGGYDTAIASEVMKLPFVRGIEWGAGFAYAELNGKIGKDAFYIEDCHIKTRLNLDGGVQGGITNGMPLVFTVLFDQNPEEFERYVHEKAKQIGDM